MVTFKEIAEAAGVSHGTVSNVLNHRGNVSAKKIQLVEQTAQRLGYRINSKAQVLRKGYSNTIALILPNISNHRFAILFETLMIEFAAANYLIQLWLTQGIDELEKKALSDAMESRVCAIIVDSCLEDAAAFYSHESPDLPVCFIDKCQTLYSNSCSIAFNAKQAACDIGQFICQHSANSVGVFIGESLSETTRIFIEHLRTKLYQNDITLKIVYCPEHQIDISAFELFSPDISYDYIICSDERREVAVRTAHSYASTNAEPQYIALSVHRALENAQSLNYSFDYKMMAHNITKMLLPTLEHQEKLPNPLIMDNSGFSLLKVQDNSPSTLRLLTVASPSSEALMRLLPLLERSAGIKLDITIMSLDEIYELLKTKDVSLPYDLVRMDMAWLDELAPYIYQPLRNIPLNWKRLCKNYLPEFTEYYTKSKGVPCALPYDPSTQILFYRRDLFESSIYKRLFFEQTKQELKAPESFEEYNQIARFFTKSFNPDSPTKYGSTLAISGATVSASEFLVRLYGFGGDIFDSLGRIHIDTDCACAALQNYVEAYNYSDKAPHLWWKNALEGFADGSAAMTVVFMNHASDILNLKHSTIAGKIGFAMVPNNHPIIGGGVIGITPACSNITAACNFLEWFYSIPVASAFTTLGGLSPCVSVYENRDVCERYPWLRWAKKSFPLGKLRTPSTYYVNYSQRQFEKILAQEVKNAVLGISSIPDALKRAQETCDSTFIPHPQS